MHACADPKTSIQPRFDLQHVRVDGLDPSVVMNSVFVFSRSSHIDHLAVRLSIKTYIPALFNLQHGHVEEMESPRI